MFKNVDAYLLFNPSNRFYFTKFDASNGCVILTKKEKIFLTDFRYIDAAKKAMPDWNIIQIGGNYLGIIVEELKRLGAKNIGIEENTLSIDMFNKIETAIKDGGTKMKLVHSFVDIAAVRAIKTEEEIGKMAAAQIIAQKAYSKVTSNIKVGMSEREIAAELLYEMQLLGASGASFDIIVAFGENSALPHHKTGDRRLEKNDIILIDMGAKLNGYCSDMTRTFSIGDVSAKLKEIHALVLDAQNMCLKNIRAGMTGHEADIIAREYFKANGYEKEFGHSLGHGIGIDVHESTRVAATAQDILKPNMVITVEPGLYIDGIGGVRIEDMIVVQEDGQALNLTNMDKNL
ncbi:MAG: Xaa-Pro peptidase family protein [Firmicutes bacterium]|nr:Xaa-Pro peptidase family protein [Bacillota bacterium]